MKTPRALITSLCVAAATVSAPVIRAAEKPDYKTIAERIVGTCANVKEGDRVVVRGDIRDIDLLEELSFAAYRRGAEPVQIVGREKAFRRYYDEVPAARDSDSPGFSLKLAEITTVEILVAGQEHPEQLNSVAPARIGAIEKRQIAIGNARLARNVRTIELGNGLYPTEAIAKRYGLTKSQLADIFWSGVNVDYTKLQATGAAVRAAIVGASDVRVTHPNGTDLRMKLKGRPVFVSDGVISAEDLAKGGPAVQAWLPAGEVYVVPEAGSAEGVIVMERLPFEDGEILGAKFTVKAGKLVSHTAQTGPAYERWKALYSAAPTAKNDFGYLDIGINPNVKVPAGSKLATWVPAGTVSMGFGTNSWAGGDNNAGWGTALSLNGCTVTLDGKPIVEKGALKIP